MKAFVQSQQHYHQGSLAELEQYVSKLKAYDFSRSNTKIAAYLKQASMEKLQVHVASENRQQVQSAENVDAYSI